MTDRGPPSADELLRQATFVRAVARATLRGEDLVDDVVQDTWLAVFARPKRLRGSLRGWLAAVTRRRAIDAMRRESATRRREEQVRRTGAVEGVDAIAIRAETGRDLVTAVLALDAPYRRTILLRFYEGLPRREIARRMGVSPETVHTRLRRGLALLRARLAAEYGDGAAGWRSVIAPLVSAPVAKSLATGAVYGAWMAMGKSILTGGVVLAALVTTTALVVGPHSSDERARQEPPGERAVAAAPVEAREYHGAVAPPVEAAARPVVLPVGTDPVATAPPSPQPTPAAMLRGAREAAAPPEPPKPAPFASGRVEDPDGAPLEGVAVLARCTRFAANGQRLVNPIEAPGRSDGIAGTDAQGTFAVASAPEHLEALVFVKPGWAATEVRGLADGAESNQGLVVVLAPGRRLTGVVTDEEGMPLPGARILCFPDGPGPHVGMLATTGEEGHYRFESLPRVATSVWVHAFGYGSTAGDSGDVEAKLGADVASFDVTLRRSSFLVDVADASTKQPIADARGVVLEAEGGAFVGLLTPIQDRNSSIDLRPLGRLTGEFPFRGAGKPAKVVDVRLFAPGYRPVIERLDTHGMRRPPHLRVALDRGEAPAALAGTVVGAPGAVVEVRAKEPRYTAYWEKDLPLMGRQTADEKGGFAFRGLPDGPYRLVVEAGGFAPLARDVETPADSLRIEPERAASLSISAVSATGERVPEVWITVDSRAIARRWQERTGPDGVARFKGLPPGPVVFLATRAPEHTGPIRDRAGHYSGGFASEFVQEIELSPGESVEAPIQPPTRVATTIVVRDASGRPRGGIGLRLLCGHPYAPIIEEWKRVDGLRPITDLDGRVTVDLYPGGYDCWIEGASTTNRLMHRVFVGLLPGEPVEIVTPNGTCAVFGRVAEQGSGQHIPGRPVRVLSPDGRQTLGEAVLDEDGRYEIRGLHPGRVRVVLELRADSAGSLTVHTTDEGRAEFDSPYPRVESEVVLGHGERHELSVAVPRVRGPGAAEHPYEMEIAVRDRETGLPLSGAQGDVDGWIDGLWMEAGRFETHEEGRATAHLLAAIRYRVHVHVRETAANPRYQAACVDVEASGPRGHLDVDLRTRPVGD